jgi:hypothetical protein
MSEAGQLAVEFQLLLLKAKQSCDVVAALGTSESLERSERSLL